MVKEAGPNACDPRMKHLDLTLPTPAENLACDEALLDWGDAHGGAVLRCWEPAREFVVVGFANKVAVEVNQPACAAAGVAIYRRCSGGGTVLQGPGCLNYSLVLPIPEHGWLAGISGTNQFVMHRQREAIEGLLGQPVTVRGHTDLALDGRKFSGNAQRRKRRALLFHGTFLCSFELPLIGRLLQAPSKEPDYRQGRSHADFLINLGLPPARIKARLREIWQADEDMGDVPLAAMQKLVEEKYSTAAWNGKF